MRQAMIYYKDIAAGVLTETDDGFYEYQYLPAYIDAYPEQFICFTMPVVAKPYKANRLFPFFDGLIPEGWLLDIAAKNWKISPNDRMGLLLACCANCIGAVSVKSYNQQA
ncbi:HipA N-terminal domain-containing protein [Deminuibacter soli]|uniref:Phosphatidylinositol kinase n=1 Tax=Deminuibacter soli TaxID=2291815 RepID=A0A3E1NME1_9BACT|nr:HipA N-terminal domain-containing protein [Deminuibacter soli]RFM29082.1 phosphatidylinositol kinase [Deminuibacter soli]